MLQALFHSGSGYLQTFLPDHPVASANGLVSVHRQVLYDAIGPGWHMCRWCHQPVSWDRTVPRFARLVVDHLDNDKANNDRSNLAPSCDACNRQRGINAYHEKRKGTAA